MIPACSGWQRCIEKPRGYHKTNHALMSPLMEVGSNLARWLFSVGRLLSYSCYRHVSREMIELTERFCRNKKRSKSHFVLPFKRESGGNHKVTGTHCSRSNFLITKYLKADAWDLKPFNVNTDETMAGELFRHLKKHCSAAALQSNLVHSVFKGWFWKLNDCERVSLKQLCILRLGLGGPHPSAE